MCVSSTYDFSNWITVSDNCGAAHYNDFYINTSLPSYNYVEQWYVCVSAYKRVHACTKLHPRHLVLVHTPCSIGVSHIWLSIPAVLQ